MNYNITRVMRKKIFVFVQIFVPDLSFFFVCVSSPNLERYVKLSMSFVITDA